jgi:hypothetical protein
MVGVYQRVKKRLNRDTYMVGKQKYRIPLSRRCNGEG